MDRLRVLLLEDSAADAELAQRALAGAGLDCEVTHAASRERFELAFGAGRFDFILADYNLPAYSGIEALEHVRARDALIPFILVSGTVGEERAVDALRAGVTDYVLKTALARLPSAVLHALAQRREREQHLETQRA